jgi:hypothetical protein
MITIHAAGTSGECRELPWRVSDASDVEELYARFCARFPQVKAIAGRVACRDAEPEAVAWFIGERYRIADPSLAAIPP